MGKESVGSVRAFVARLISAGGYVAYRTRRLPPGRRPIVDLVTVAVLSFIGVGFLVGAYHPFTAASPNYGVGLGLLLLAAWVLAGTLAGYLVFIGSGSGQTVAGWAYPEHDATVRVSGIADGFLNRVVKIRDSRGALKLADYADRAAPGGSPSTAISSPRSASIRVPWWRFKPGACSRGAVRGLPRGSTSGTGGS